MSYSERTKQAAYELYRGNPNRPLDRLAADLEQLPDGAFVPVDTIRDWRNRYTWDKRIQQEIAAASPVLMSAHVSLARVAGLDGLTYLRDVANGAQEYERHRVEVAKFLVEEVRPMLRFATADEEPVHIQPARLNLLKAGAPASPPAADVRELTNDELVLLEDTPGWTS